MIDGTKTLKITDFGLATLLDTEISGDADLRREIGDLGKRVANVSRTGEDRRRECHGVPQASASSAFSWQCRCPSAIARRALEWSPCLDPGENHASFSPMARKSLTLERESPTPQPAVKTGADALEFYRRKTVWLSPKNLAGIERQLREKRRSPRS